MLEGEMIRINLNYTVKALLTPMAMKSSTCMEGGRLVFCFLMRKMSFLPIAKRCSIAGGREGGREGGGRGRERDGGRGEGGGGRGGNEGWREGGSCIVYIPQEHTVNCSGVHCGLLPSLSLFCASGTVRCSFRFLRNRAESMKNDEGG